MSTAGERLSCLWRVMSIGFMLVIYAALSACSSDVAVAAPDPDEIIVKLRGLDPKIRTAIGRVIETGETATLQQGGLSFQACENGQSISVWAPGYYIQTLTCNGSIPGYYELSMDRLDAADNPNYQWISATDPALGCAPCHSDGAELNEYLEWTPDGHTRTFASPLFWATYLGTNVNHVAGQKTIWGFSPDGSRYRLPPDPNQPDYGPGYQLDYPDSNGNCAFCHAPAAVGPTKDEVDLVPFINSLWAVQPTMATEGVTCDVCHKAIDVVLDEQGLPYVDRPGVLSFSFLRPNTGGQFVAGPWSHLTTSMPGIRRTCNPIFSQSSFCAACHYARFSGVEVYASYKEWLQSPYNKPDENFRSCQDCHMQVSGSVNWAAPATRGACSPESTSFRSFSHNMMRRDNVGDPILIQRAATVGISAIREAGKIKVNVNVVNTAAGHKFPTDSPLRHLILVVEARDQNGVVLSQVDGPRIPDWGGTGSSPQDYAGRPGLMYANILKDKDTSMVPAAAYWNPTMPAWQGSDTRLLPGQDTPSQYFFVAPSQGIAIITAQLFYRNAFIDILRKKGLQPQDILVNWAVYELPE